jgi:UDP-N-acetylmuramate dehydrogenase
VDLQENLPLAPLTTLGVGGPARWFAHIESEAGLLEALQFARDRSLPTFILGGGSNLLVSDAGFPGLVLRIAIPGRTLQPADATHTDLIAGAGEPWDPLVDFAVQHSLAGIECLAGIPGSTGGTPVQNVGAYGQEVAQTIHSVRALDLEAQALDSSAFVDLPAAECGFAYRTSIFNSTQRNRYIVTGVTFHLAINGAPALRYGDLQRRFAAQLAAGSQPTLAEVATSVRAIRATKGMLAGQPGPNTRSAGSFFKNPMVDAEAGNRIAAVLGLDPSEVPHWPATPDASGHPQVKLPAAWLIERAGLPRGFTLGRAGISTVHTLALVNLGGATAAELLALRDHILRTVAACFGVTLEQEPVLLGF